MTKLDLAEICPELAELMNDTATCHTADLLVYALDKKDHTRRFKALLLRLEAIAATMLKLAEENERLEKEIELRKTSKYEF